MSVDPELERAYRDTRYRVPSLSLELFVGQASAQLDALLKQYDTREWAFVSAVNPCSRLLADAENRIRHQQLRQAVAARGYPWFEGEGLALDQGWPAEPSLLILGIPRREAIALGRRFEQNAVVTGYLGQPARLDWCRE
jgi:hypothetical protein